MTEKIILALEYARTRKHPVVLLCTGGPVSAQAGPLALVQGGRLATEIAQLHLSGLPVIGVLTHPMAGELFGTLAAHCDVLYSEPGVRVGTAAESRGGIPTSRHWRAVDDLLHEGWIDGIVDRSRLKGQIGAFVDLIGNPGTARATHVQPTASGNPPSVGDSVANLDHPDRPTADALVSSLVSGFVELHGDRVRGDDQLVMCGVGRFESLSIAIAAQRRTAGETNEQSDAIAARKIARLARMAGRLELPLVMLVDGGRQRGSTAFIPESAFAVSSLAAMLSLLPVPVIAVGTGRVAGPLATAMMIGDRQLLMSSAIYSPTSDPTPGFGYVPHQSRPQGRNSGMLGALSARECERLGLVDGVIFEPTPGAHADADGAISAIRSALLLALAELTGTGQRRLLDTRHRRQRTLGQSTPEGLAAARSELWELQEWQRSVGRSIDEWRIRWDQLKASQPRLSFQRPDMSELATRLRARRTELLDRARSGDRSAE